MQLADGAAGEPHIDPGNFLRDLEVGLSDLAGPAAILNAARRVVEGRPEHRHIADVGRWGENAPGNCDANAGFCGPTTLKLEGLPVVLI